MRGEKDITGMSIVKEMISIIEKEAVTLVYLHFEDWDLGLETQLEPPLKHSKSRLQIH